ncbi:MAG TPA: HEAT repeat domain-containing protein [bacterium]|nr:HEAT repeat domain-containing protein [bacterium]
MNRRPQAARLVSLALLALVSLAPAAQAKLSELVEISNLEDRRSLGDGRLAQLLREGDDETRAAAARALGRIGSEDGVMPLIDALSDSDEDVRLEVVFALGQIGSAEARDALSRIAGSNASPEERGEAVLALGKLGGDGAAEAVLPLLADPLPALRADAAYALARTGDSLAVADLAPLLKDPDPEVRTAAVWAAGRLHAKELAPAVRELLADSDGGVKLAATKSAGELEDIEAIRPLSLLAKDPDWRVRVNVAGALGRMKVTDALAGLAILGKDENVHVRAAVATGLKDIPFHFKKDDILFPLVKDPEPEVRAATMQTLAVGLEGQESSLQEHWTSCGDSSTAVVIAAYESFADASRRMPQGSGGNQWRTASWFYMKGRLGNPTAPLAEKVIAAYNVGAFENAEPRNTLIESLTVTDPVLTAAALHGLGELTPNDTTLIGRHYEETPPIIARVLAEDPAAKTHPDIRQSAAEALGNMDSAASREILRGLLDDPVWRVRNEAADALEKLGEPRPEVKPAGELPPPADPLDDEYLKTKQGRWEATVSTSRGEFVIELLNRDAPRTVQNFVNLVEDGFYNGLVFHRVVPNFVAQTGCPIGNGWGGPGYDLRCEYNRNRYERGMVGMAHAGKDTGGSQWFVTHSPQHHLDGRYTVFGRVTEGMDVVDQLRVEDTIQSISIKKKLW